MARARGSQLKRKIDHAVGTPLLLALGSLRSRRSVPPVIGTVGIISCAAIGDTIIASAIARDLKAALPSCRVIAFISSSSRGITHLVEGFDQEVLLPVTRPLAALRVLHEHPTDVLIDIMAWPRMTALLTALARTRYTIGFSTSRQHRHFAFDSSIRHVAHRHEVDNVRALLAPLGVASGLRPRARSAIAGAGRSAIAEKAIVLHPWASGFRSFMREWPEDCWAELARSLIADGSPVVITGGPADRSRADSLCARIDRPGRVMVLAGKATLLETAEQLASASAVISVNTGIMHLAASLDCPLVALHGPTDPLRWGPLSDAADVIGPGRSEGGAYLNLGFEYPEDAPDCMSAISVDEVLALARLHLPARATAE